MKKALAALRPTPTERFTHDCSAPLIVCNSVLNSIERLGGCSILMTSAGNYSIRPKGFNVEIGRITLTGVNAGDDLTQWVEAVRKLSWARPVQYDENVRANIAYSRRNRARRRKARRKSAPKA